MRLISFSRGIGMAAFFLAAGCATADRDIRTPAGPIAGQISGNFVILGIANQATSTRSRPGGTGEFLETIAVDVPAETVMIVPALRGWDLGYGSTDPEDLSPGGTAFSWRPADHHLGMASVNVTVIDIGSLVPGATTRRASIEVSARLTDVNGDDPWWGVIRYQLLYLGRAP